MIIKKIEDVSKTSFFFMLRPEKSIYIFLLVIGFSIFFFLSWSIFSPIEENISVLALLKPINNISSVRCLSSGKVSNIRFINGTYINKGDILFSIDSDFMIEKLELYKIQKINIESEILAIDNLISTIEKGKIDINEMYDIEVYLASNLFLIEKKQYDYAIIEVRNNLLREQEQPDLLKVPQKEADLNFIYEKTLLEFNKWENTKKREALSKKKDLENILMELRISISEIEQEIKSSVIVAPISGIVQVIKIINSGDNVIAGEEILRIIPNDSEELKVDLYIDSSDIVKVKVGNKVILKFFGLPPNEWGYIETTISFIPSYATLTESGGTIFVAEAIIQNNTMSNKFGNTIKLIPGITSEGKIITDKLTVIKQIFRKLDFWA